jgi:Tfp pilus assembly protein FimT
LVESNLDCTYGTGIFLVDAYLMLNQKISGYTLIELLVAAGLAALLIAIAVPLYRDYQGNAVDASILAQITMIEEPLVVYTQTHESIGVCQDYASVVNLPLMDNAAVDLQLTFSLVDDKDVKKGYRAGVVVSADPTQNIKAATEIHHVMQQRSRVAKGAVVSDSFVAFEIFLTPAADPFCEEMSTSPTIAAATTSKGSSLATGSTSAIPPVAAPQVTFSFNTQQQVVEFGTSGTGSVINNGPLQTGGDMKQLAVEFNVIGGPQVATQGSHGATFLSYGVPGNENEFYVWKPDDMTVRVHGVEYATGIDTTTDTLTHRYSILWSAATAKLQVLVDGVVRFTKDGVGSGYAIPGGGVLALAQDQDRFQFEDGTYGGNHGFAPGDAFHGQIFSTAMASRAPDAAALANAPLSSLVGPSNGLIADIQMENGQAKDLTGKHQLTVHGDVVSRTVSVDTSVAIPNPGATLAMTITAAPQSGDSLIGLKLVGLLPGTSVSDGAGHSGSGASIEILGWDLSSLTAALPAGVKQNMTIGVIATAKGRRGDLATAAKHHPLVLDPGQAVPASST